MAEPTIELKDYLKCYAKEELKSNLENYINQRNIVDCRFRYNEYLIYLYPILYPFINTYTKRNREPINPNVVCNLIFFKSEDYEYYAISQTLLSIEEIQDIFDHNQCYIRQLELLSDKHIFIYLSNYAWKDSNYNIIEYVLNNESATSLYSDGIQII